MAQVHPMPVDAAPPAGRRASRSADGSFLRQLPVILFAAVVVSLLLKTFLVQAFFIPSASMEPTLHGCPGCTGDRVLVNKLSTRLGQVQRGDVIVFKDPGGWLGGQPPLVTHGPFGAVSNALQYIGLAPAATGDDLIKRVIGVAGDHVVGHAGTVSVNGVALREPYVFPGDSPTDLDFSVTVPPHRLWVMGDHRGDSADSRAHQQLPGHGFVPVDDVIGRAFVLIWPVSRFGLLTRPQTFDAPGLTHR